jgi:hypothetical protein
VQLVQCSNEFCLIGWFHAQCCIDDLQLLGNHKFLCDFCTHRATSSDSDVSADSSQGTFPAETSIPPTLPDPISNSASDDGSDDIPTTPVRGDDYGEEAYYEPSDADEDGRLAGPSTSPLQALPVTPSPGSFTPINQRYHNIDTSPFRLNLDGATDAKIRPVATYRQTPPLLADFASLADFAPFMSYQLFPDSMTGLQEQDILNFEAWRHALPPSRLVSNLIPGGAVALQDLPKGSRVDLRKRAGEWIDRLMPHQRKNMEDRLFAWVEREL